MLGDNVIYRCPRSLMNEVCDEDYRLMIDMIELAQDYEKGFLPQAGGIKDQDQNLMQGIRIAHNLLMKKLNEDMKLKANQPVQENKVRGVRR